MYNVQLGKREIGPSAPVYVIAEIGINHNGDVEQALALVDVAADAGCDAVKTQKRTVDIVFSAEELARPRPNPFGATNGDLKYGLELSVEQHREIAAHAAGRGLAYTASAWDEVAVDDVEQLAPAFFKIASASLTDDDLLRQHRKYDRPVLLSTGMSTLEQIDHAVEVLGAADLVLLQCTSTYPASADELDLRAIPTLAARYGVPVGYSGHEAGTAATVAAVALGATVVERHITLDRASWGSDQASSIEPDELNRLVAEIRFVERALGSDVKRLHGSEEPVRDKLRRVG